MALRRCVGFNFLALDRDGYSLAAIGSAPNRQGHVALQDHVVGKYPGGLHRGIDSTETETAERDRGARRKRGNK